MHEQSETIQNADGKWINVYGKALPKAGQQLPGTKVHDTVDEAVKDAKARSESFHEEPRPAEVPTTGHTFHSHPGN